MLVFGDVIEPLTIAQGETVSITASQSNSTVDVHGALTVSGGTKEDPIKLGILNALNVGCAAGDAATVTVGDFGQISMLAKPLTIGGAGGTGLVTVGGRRRVVYGQWIVEITEASETAQRFFEIAAYHLYCGNISVPADATAESGVLDIIRLDPNGALFQTQNSDRIKNLSSSCDARILFNGGFLGNSNSYGAKYRFSSTAGKALILESVNGNPIMLCELYGNSTTIPTEGLVKTAGAGDVVVRSGTGSSNHFGWKLYDTSFVWQHTGDLRLSYYMCVTCDSTNALPCLADGGDVVLDGDNEYNWINLAGFTQPVNGLIAADQSIISNSSAKVATLVFGSQRPDGTLCAPNMTKRINVEKVGTGTLTITNTPAFDALEVKAGTVRFVAPVAAVSIGKISVQAGATLVIDGVTVSSGKISVDTDATVTLLNGGRLVLESAGAGTFQEGPLKGVCAEKTGNGVSYLAATNGTGLAGVHVCGGTLAVVQRGTTNEFWRVTIKETSVPDYELNLGPFRLYGEAGTFCDGGVANGTTLVYTQVANTTAPENLLAKQVMFSSTDYKPASEYTDGKHGSDNQYVPERAMFADSSVFSCRFDFKPLLSNPETWLVATYRIPALNGGFVTGYNVKSQWDGWKTRYPGTWKVESSPSGADGTWETMDEQVGQVGPNGQSWYRGHSNYNNGYPMNAADRPSPGFDPDACVQVDGGATLDCTRVMDAQEIANLAVDLSAGGGTLKNVRFAADGTLNLVNMPAGMNLSDYDVPLTFDGVSGTANVSSWTVLVDGAENRARLTWFNGGLRVFGSGTLILFK